MKEFVVTDRLILSRYLFEESVPVSVEYIQQQGMVHRTSPQMLSALVKKNRERYRGILGWWDEIDSPYSAKKHILEDNKLWKRKKQLQYYIYEKENQTCVGIICALCDPIAKKAYTLGWLNEAVQGRHYASEIQTALDKELFVTMAMEYVSRECSRKNPNFPRVQSFLTHAGYKIVQEKEFSVIWEKSARTYFEENPHLRGETNPRQTKTAVQPFSRILSLFMRQRDERMGKI